MKKVIVEIMPNWLRGTHRAANNWGVYPMNGAERKEFSAEEAKVLIAEDAGEYNHIVKSRS